MSKKRKSLTATLFSLFDLCVNLIQMRKPEILEALESYFAYKQGKGWGYSSTEVEAKYVAHVYKEILKKKGGAVVLDIGANKGQYLSALLKNFKDIKVIAFEPSHTCVAFLQKEFGHLSNVHIYNYAIGNREGEIEIFYDREGSTLGSQSQSYLDFMSETPSFSELVPITTLDSFCRREFIIPNIIKLDVEGFELEVLMGSEHVLSGVSIVQFEFGSANLFSRTFFIDFYDFFTNRGFTLHRVAKHRLITIETYNEMLEHFRATNYLAVRLLS